MLWLLLACSSPCPPGLRPEPALEAALIASLSAEPLSAPLVDGPLRACFGAPPEPALDAEGRLLLPTPSGPVAELAPRVAHLLLHRQRGLRPDAPREEAREVAREEARAVEAEAIALEVNLREAMGLAPVLPGEAALRGLPAAERAAHVAEQWRSAGLHGRVSESRPPDGAPP